MLGVRNVIYAIKNILHRISNRLETTEEWVTDLVERSIGSIHVEVPNNRDLSFWMCEANVVRSKGKNTKFLNMFNHMQRYFYTIFLGNRKQKVLDGLTLENVNNAIDS